MLALVSSGNLAGRTRVTAEIEAVATTDAAGQRLMAIPGVQPISATAIVAAIGHFERQEAAPAWHEQMRQHLPPPLGGRRSQSVNDHGRASSVSSSPNRPLDCNLKQMADRVGAANDSKLGLRLDLLRVPINVRYESFRQSDGDRAHRLGLPRPRHDPTFPTRPRCAGTVPLIFRVFPYTITHVDVSILNPRWFVRPLQPNFQRDFAYSLALRTQLKVAGEPDEIGYSSTGSGLRRPSHQVFHRLLDTKESAEMLGFKSHRARMGRSAPLRAYYTIQHGFGFVRERSGSSSDEVARDARGPVNPLRVPQDGRDGAATWGPEVKRVSAETDFAALLANPVRANDVPAATIPTLAALLSTELNRLAAVAGGLAARLAVSTPTTGRHEDDDQLLTVAQVASFLNVPEGYVGDLGRRGALPRVPFGKYVRFRLSDIRAWIVHHREPGLDEVMMRDVSHQRHRRRGPATAQPAGAQSSAARGVGRSRPQPRGSLEARQDGDTRVGGTPDAIADKAPTPQEKPEMT